MKISRQLFAFTALTVIVISAIACNKKQAADSSAAGSLLMHLAISPDRPSMTKPITFRVHITDEQQTPVSDAQVTGALTMKLMDMPPVQLNFTPKGNGYYEASVKSVDMSGPWSMTVSATQGGTNVKQSFDVTVFD